MAKQRPYGPDLSFFFSFIRLIDKISRRSHGLKKNDVGIAIFLNEGWKTKSNEMFQKWRKKGLKFLFSTQQFLYFKEEERERSF